MSGDVLVRSMVGLQKRTDGDASAFGLRQGAAGDLIVSEAHGKYYEAASRGLVYYFSTAVPTLGLNNTLGPVNGALYNPPGSRYNIVPISFEFGFNGAAATATAGFYELTWAPNIASTNTPVGAAGSFSTLLSNALPPNPVLIAAASGTVFTTINFAQVAGGPWGPYSLVPLSTKMAGQSGTLQPAVPGMRYDFDGRIVLQPGQAIWIAQSSADTTNVSGRTVWFWEEVPRY